MTVLALSKNVSALRHSDGLQMSDTFISYAHYDKSNDKSAMLMTVNLNQWLTRHYKPYVKATSGANGA